VKQKQYKVGYLKIMKNLNPNKFSIFALNLLLLQSFGCSRAKEESASSQSFILKGVQWPGGVAQVCWITPGFELQKKEIEKYVTLNFNDKTNMKFLGFQACPNSTDFAGVKIAIVDLVNNNPDSAGRSNFGSSKSIDQSPDWEKSNKPTLYLKRKLFENEKTSPLINTALHEFGHAAGLLHEHSRQDVNAGCKEYLSGSGNETDERRLARKIGAEAERIGPYDKHSIMSYCKLDYMDELNEVSTLTQGDIDGINKLYPKP
jgi:Astacin (Peptidase family M12A)